MAPEVTTTTRLPPLRTAATSAASLSMAPVSTRPDAVVTDEEPIFTTRVRAVGPCAPAGPELTAGGACCSGSR